MTVAAVVQEPSRVQCPLQYVAALVYHVFMGSTDVYRSLMLVPGVLCSSCMNHLQTYTTIVSLADALGS